MKLRLSSIRANANQKVRDRVGRGSSSGKGKTAGRGHKGQNSRSGHSHRFGFEGGQTPLHRRIPKYGFRNLRGKGCGHINLATKETFRLSSAKSAEILVRTLGLLSSRTRLTKLFGPQNRWS